MIGEEAIVTLNEYIDQQDAIETEALEVLPHKFDECSYPYGYVHQTIYSCLSCRKDKNPVAVCYSCSIECHTTCELVELGWRRHLRCDCGQAPSTTQCRLYPEKVDANRENDYSGSAGHNFDGLFCSCDEPFNHEDSDDMYQCLVCQDWYHEKCIGSMPDADSFDDFVCALCTLEHPVLSTLGSQNCLDQTNVGPVFLRQDWKLNICKCDKCVELLLPFKFLLRTEPSWEPEIDKPYDKLSKVIPKDKVALDGILQGYQDLKRKFSDFLTSNSGKLITKDDIEVFFGNLNSHNP